MRERKMRRELERQQREYRNRERVKDLRDELRNLRNGERIEERQPGGYCIYGLDGSLLHAPNGKRCAATKAAQNAATGPWPGSPAAPQSGSTGAVRAAPAGGHCETGNCRNGNGTYAWPNGSRYVGAFKSGTLNGYGTLVGADGSSYVGNWRNGKRDGQGMAIRADGHVQSGAWQADRFVGGAYQPPVAATRAVRWPNLAKPAKPVGGGSKDAAVVIGIEDYAHVSDIPLAASNASSWYRYLVKTRDVPLERVALLRDEDATLEEMRHAVEEAARQVKRGGTLWFIFIGHGAPAKNGKDGLLVGYDAQQKARSIEVRSLHRSELLATLEKSRAGKVNVLLDACFSGRAASGAQLVAGLQPLVVTSLEATGDARTTVLTAARSDEYAGPLPGAGRPAFSYLTLGGLRGWADQNSDGDVTAGELHSYVSRAMQALVRDRRQRPTLVGRRNASMARSPRETGPDLSALVLNGPASP